MIPTSEHLFFSSLVAWRTHYTPGLGLVSLQTITLWAARTNGPLTSTTRDPSPIPPPSANNPSDSHPHPEILHRTLDNKRPSRCLVSLLGSPRFANSGGAIVGYLNANRRNHRERRI